MQSKNHATPNTSYVTITFYMHNLDQLISSFRNQTKLFKSTLSYKITIYTIYNYHGEVKKPKFFLKRGLFEIAKKTFFSKFLVFSRI